MDKAALIEALKDQIADGQLRNVCLALIVLFKDHEDQRLKNWEIEARLQSARFSDLRREERIGATSRGEIQRDYIRLSQNLLSISQDFEEADLEVETARIKEAAKILASPEARVPLASYQEGLGTIYQYDCNRKDQEREFRFGRPKNELRSCHFFCVHGEKQQSHGGLVNRFYLKYLKGFDENWEGRLGRKVILEEAHEIELYKTEIKYKLYEGFDLIPDYLGSEEELTLANLIGQITDRYGYLPPRLAIEIRIRSTSWKKFTPELIKWFSQEYCDEAKLPKGSPDFYFFLSVIYHQPVPVKKSGWANLFRRSEPDIDPNEKLRQTVQQLPGCKILTELNPVTWTDLEIWVTKHLIADSNPQKIARLLKKYFPENRANYDMAVVELRLEEIINEFNLALNK